MKDIQIPSSRRQASQLSCHFPLHLFSPYPVGERKGCPILNVTVAPLSRKNHGRASLRGWHANSSPSPSRERETNRLFIPSTKSILLGGARSCADVKKGAVTPGGWMDGTTDGRARQTPYDGLSKTGFLPSLLSTTDAVLNIDSRNALLQLNRYIYITYIRSQNQRKICEVISTPRNSPWNLSEI